MVQQRRTPHAPWLCSCQTSLLGNEARTTVLTLTAYRVLALQKYSLSARGRQELWHTPLPHLAVWPINAPGFSDDDWRGSSYSHDQSRLPAAMEYRS